MSLIEITPKTFPRLQAHLERQQSPDPYAVSPAYYRFTGRRGLFVLESGASALIVCRHPNLAGIWLAFPPFGPEGPSLLRIANTTLPNLQLARFPHAPGFGFDAVPETILDWRFPVHTLDPARVAQLDGPHFRGVRAKVKRAQRQGVTARTLKTGDLPQILTMAGRWSDRQHQSLSRDQLIGSHKDIFAIYADPGANLDGIALECSGQLVGYRIWERPRGLDAMASSLGAMTRTKIPGVSEYAMHAMAERVVAQGGRALCIGGSETASLDAFKRKFCPIWSTALSSFKAGCEEKLAA